MPLDSDSAFPRASQSAVHQTLEAYARPRAHMQRTRRTQAGSRHAVDNPSGESAARRLCKGPKQGCPASPAFHATSQASLVWMARATGHGRRLPTRRPMHGLAGDAREVGATPDPMAAYVDDTTRAAQGHHVVQEAQELVLLIETSQPWSAVSLHVQTSISRAITLATGRQSTRATPLYIFRGLPKYLSPSLSLYVQCRAD